jgi:ATP-dependent helicase HrpA
VVPQVLAATGPDDGPLLEVLPPALGRIAGQAVSVTEADLREVPADLRVTYRVVDDKGRPVAWSRDLRALRARMVERQRAALTERSPLPALEGLTTWPAGDSPPDADLPRTVEVRHLGMAVTGYPALVDEGDTVARRVLPSEAEQRTAMWGGTRRLLLLQLGSPLRTLDRSLGNATKLALTGSTRVGAAEAYRGATEAAVDHLLLAAGGPVWDAAAFADLLAKVRAGFVDTAVAAATTVGQVLATVAAVDKRLASLHHEALDETAVDIGAHLERLLRPGWINEAGVDRLGDVARYATAIEHRLSKATTEPARDRARLPALHALERDYRAVAPLDRDGTLRWQLEELRVATFAQAAGAKGSPSEPKLRAAIAALEAG